MSIGVPSTRPSFRSNHRSRVVVARRVIRRASSCSSNGTATRRVVPSARRASLTVNGCGSVFRIVGRAVQRVGPEHDAVGDPGQPPDANRRGQLLGAEVEFFELVGLRSAERLGGQPAPPPCAPPCPPAAAGPCPVGGPSPSATSSPVPSSSWGTSSAAGSSDLLAQRLQRHARRDVVIGGPPFHGRHHLLTPLGPPLRVDDPLADPLPRHLKTHGAQLIRSRACRRAGASGRQLVSPAARGASATQPWRAHVEHLDARRDPVLAGVPQQPDVADAQRQRVAPAAACRSAQWPDVDRHRRGTDVQHQLAVQLARRPAARRRSRPCPATRRESARCRRGRCADGPRPADSPRRARPRRPRVGPGPATADPRTVTRRPACSSSSPTRIVPAASVPVTTVPAPRTVNERSTHSRTSASRSGGGSRSTSETNCART